jgi:BASS family bile acid:Na+ symporter
MFTIPFLVNMSLDFFVNRHSTIVLPVLQTIQHIALVTIIPAIIGLMIRNRLPKIADHIRPVLKYLLPALLLLIFSVKIFAPASKGGIELSRTELWEQCYWVLMLNFSGMFLGYVLGLIFRIRLQNRVTIMVEVGLQNTALALLIAGNILNNANMQKPAMVYAIFTFFSTLIFAWLIREAEIRIFGKSEKKS